MATLELLALITAIASLILEIINWRNGRSDK